MKPLRIVQLELDALRPRKESYAGLWCGGIWYLAKSPKGWTLFPLSFRSSKNEIDHAQFWEAAVAPFLSREWRLGASMIREFALLAYAFPRGRAVKEANRTLFYHGRDFARFASRDQIARAFSLQQYTFKFDFHERCQQWDKEEARRILGIPENWAAHVS